MKNKIAVVISAAALAFTFTLGQVQDHKEVSKSSGSTVELYKIDPGPSGG